MCLSEFQRAFADLIAAPERCLTARQDPDGAFAGYGLTDRECQRLARMVSDPGMSVNCTLYRVNRLTPVYSVLPLTCGLLGEQLVSQLDAFWGSGAEATIQYGREAARFGGWLQARMAEGALPGPVRDALAFELAAFEVRTAQGGDGADASSPEARKRWIRFTYDPAEVLDPERRPGDLVPLAQEEWVLLDATGDGLKVFSGRAPATTRQRAG
jgi:hypothetical protein